MTPARAACAIGVAALVLLQSTPASAAFTSALTRATAAVGSSTLQAPAAVTATCAQAGPTSTATITWPASTSTYATGYRISYTGGSTATIADASSPRSIPGLAKNTTYTFTVTTVFRNWTSVGRTSLTTSC